MAAVVFPPASAGTLVEQILDEGPVGMAGIARLCGSYRAGKPTHPSTCTRWAVNGVRLADGTVVRLDAVRLNGRLVSSRQAFIRFVQAQQQQPADGPAADAVRTPAARRKASVEAARQLEKLGC